MSNTNRTPLVGSATLAGVLATRVLGTLRTPLVGALALAGVAGTLVSGTVLKPATGALSAQGQPAIFGPAVYTQQGTLFFGDWTNTALTPGVGALAFDAKDAPPLGRGLVPSVASLNTTGVAPTNDRGVIPVVGALVSSGVAGSRVTGTVQTPSAGASTLSGTTPNFDAGVVPSVGALTLTGVAPAAPGITPSVGALALTGGLAGVPNDTSRTPGMGELFLGIFGDFPLSPATGSLAFAGAAPTLKVEGISPATRTPTVGLLSFGLFLDSPEITAPASGLALSGAAPILQQSQRIVSTGTLALTGAAPTVDRGAQAVTPNRGAIAITRFAPSIAGQAGPFTPGTGTLEFGIIVNTSQLPATGTLTLTGKQANPPDNTDRTPGTGQLLLTRPTSATALPLAGTLTLTGKQANPPDNQDLTPGTGTLRLFRGVEVVGTGLALAGAAPVVQAGGTVSDTPITPTRGSLVLTPFLGVPGRGMVVNTGSLALTGIAPTTDQSNYDIQPHAGMLRLVGTLSAQPNVAPTGIAQEGCGSVNGTAVEGCASTTTTAQEGCGSTAATITAEV